MNKARKIAATLLLAVGIISGTAGVAAAATSYVGGGEWQHGIQGGYVYSHYYHASRCHGSTAVGTYTVRASAPAGNYSYANAPKAWTNNQTYWRNTC
jgi:bacteriocin, lactococcin 972 family